MMKRITARMRKTSRAQRTDQASSLAPDVGEEEDDRMLSLDKVTDNEIHDEDSGKKEDPYDDNPFGELGDEEDPYDRGGGNDDDNDDDVDDEGGHGNNHEGGSRSDSDDSYDSDDSDAEDEEDEEEGVEEGLRGAKAVHAAIELMHSGVHKIDLAGRLIFDEDAVALGEELRNNESLTSLDLSENYIQEKGGIALAQALSNNNTLTTLDLGYYSRWQTFNVIGPAGAAELAAALATNESLTSLDLGGNKIGVEGVIALGKVLEGRCSIVELNLQGNELGEDGAIRLAEALGGNSTLTSLNLDSNAIGAKGAVPLSKCLRTRNSISIFSLYDNNIGDEGAIQLGEILGESESLTELFLGSNEIGDRGAAKLGEGLGMSRTLTVLGLSCNKIGDEGADNLGEGLGKSKSLLRLHLSGNKIGDKGTAGLGRGLGKSESLTALHLHGNNIGDDGAAQLGEGLGMSKSLSELVLLGNKIGDKGAAGLGQGLCKNKSLSVLHLQDNNISDDGAACLGQGLGKSKSLTGLYIGYNRFGASGAEGLSEGLSENDSLTSLDLSGNNIGDDGAVLLGEALEENTVLTELNLAYNGIRAAGGSALGEALSKNGTLMKFNLSSNPLGPEGGSAIGEAFRLNNTLTSLDLQACDLGDGGASSIAEALSQNENSALAALRLGGNEIGDDGAGALAKALETNISLISLNLGHGTMYSSPHSGSVLSNNISEIGFTRLAEMLHHNKTLRELNLTGNKPGGDGIVKLAEALSQNVGLHDLDLNDCAISDQGVAALGKALATNSSLTELNLRRSDLGNVGADGLAEGLAKNSSLTRLTIGTGQYREELPPNALEILLESILSENEGLADVQGFPRLPERFDWQYLLTAAKGMARADRIRKYLFDVEAKKWTPAAHKLAGTFAHIFQVFVFILAQNDPEMQNLFSDPKVWLQTQEGDEDKSAENEDKLPLIHALFDCHATTTEFALQESFCTEIIAKHLKLEDGLLLMKAEDGGGRTLRSLALTNKNTKKWAKKYGTYLNRYNVVEGPPVHESKTCAVHYATDIKTNKLVALKIMRDKHQYNREISAREVTGGEEDLLKGCIKLLDRDDPSFATLLDKERCLVMPQGSRSLFEAINTERFAGRDFLKIRAIAHKIALAIKSLHDSGRIHGDIKPRNVVRVNPSVQHTFSLDGKGGRLEVPKAWRDDVTGELQSSRSNANDEEWKLIDLDASASLLNDTRVTEKVSTGYAAPELARWHFSDHAKPEEAPLTSEAIDVWGFGVVLYQMLSGTKLFMVDESDDNLVHDEDKLKLMTWLALDDKRLNRIRKRENSNGIEGKNAAVGDGLQEERRDDIEAARDLVRLCLRGDPSERIELTDILEKHPFFEPLREDASCAVQNDDVDLASSKVARKRSSKKNMRDRISRQLLGIHFRVIPRRFSLFGHTTTPELRWNASLSRFYADKAHHELIELPTYHFFLSHVQSQAAGIAKDLAFGLERHQLSAWVDMRAADITLEGMHRGILFSRCFLMVLTRDVFFRPYCLIELKYAVDHFLSTPGGLEEHIFFIVEEDERFHPWTAENDGPWESELWENGDADDLDENTDDADDLDENADDADTCEGSVLERPRSKRKSDARHHPRDELKKLGFNDTEVFTAAQDALSVCKRIPYRRREFEEDAMIRALASHAGFQKSSPFSFPSKDSLSLTVVGKAGSTIARELVAKLEAKRNIKVKAALFPSLASDTSVAIVVLEQGCRDDVEFALREGELAELPILAVAVADDKTRNLDGVHKEEFSEDVRIRLFDHLEVLTWRPSNVDREELYVVDHEQPALIDELCSRAAKLSRQSA